MVIEGSKTVEFDLPRSSGPRSLGWGAWWSATALNTVRPLTEGDPSGNDDSTPVAEDDLSGGADGRAIAFTVIMARARLTHSRTGSSFSAWKELAFQRCELCTCGPTAQTFLLLYRKLTTQISFQELRTLCANAQAAYAREVFALSRKLSLTKSLEAVQKVDSGSGLGG